MTALITACGRREREKEREEKAVNDRREPFASIISKSLFMIMQWSVGRRHTHTHAHRWNAW